uniref:DNA-binding protein HEXBP-like n=1 Tax=Nicotiana tabacum TaxID=4097 RepID=A0A1S3YH25_TOBAC|nr:PREDICTED: DNA-binding protein HEXBP-like [Nicotiana tabacum]
MVRSRERGEREAKRPRGSGGFSGVPSGGQFYRGRGHPYRHAHTTSPIHYGASSGHGSFSTYHVQSSLISIPAHSSSHAPSVQGSSAPGSSSGYSGARGSLQSPSSFAGRGCFECGDMGHIKRYCPYLMGGPAQQKSQPTTSPPVQPARGRA